MDNQLQNQDYLDFDGAVSYLRTTSSTLYKWLQTGKIPGHKLGRQWRFSKEELELHVSGKAPRLALQKEVMQLTEFLEKRALGMTKEGQKMDLQNELPEKLIWDAFDHRCDEIHLSPSMGKYEVTYHSSRVSGTARPKYEKIVRIEEGVFKMMDDYWIQQSTATKDQNSRRIYLQRSEEDALQIRYQKLETVSGPRLTLTLLQPKLAYFGLDKIGITALERETLKDWLDRPKGLILVSGTDGSGKTTTIYSLMNELKKEDRVIFTLETSAPLVIDGINQVEYASRGKEDFENKFEDVMLSNPSVLCLGLGSVFGIEKSIYSAAYQAASTGALVILQMHADTAEDAVQIFEKESGVPLKGVLVGSSWQRLVSRDGKLKAEYSFFEKT
ncbi:MAG: helix-turn-helix domain-containing protein [Proteobacteria bacterium]|nr:MAG: helix-turn-helix domain-containing protein [Pseudomonadota bacterium]